MQVIGFDFDALDFEFSSSEETESSEEEVEGAVVRSSLSTPVHNCEEYEWKGFENLVKTTSGDFPIVTTAPDTQTAGVNIRVSFDARGTNVLFLGT
jgi:hypothetical protein